jgi:L-asparaginase II
MKTHPPIEVAVTRGDRIESRHLVDAVVAGADGKLIAVHGSVDGPVYPRSAIKALQALALVESGAADSLRLSPRHIALACASHAGEDIHVEAAAEMLQAAGLAQTCLECGAHWPSRRADQNRLVLAGHEPAAIHNNCSGKHSGFLCFAVHEHMETAGYVGISHPVQRAIAGNLTEITGHPHIADNHAIDGCSIPTYPLPLANLASAFARFGVGEGGGQVRDKAMLRIRDACLAHPEMVGGSEKFDTLFMRAFGGRVFTKTGAEGVFVAAIPEKGIGLALKVRDGADRASQVAVAGLVESLLELDEVTRKSLSSLANPQLFNWNGLRVGEISGRFT